MSELKKNLKYYIGRPVFFTEKTLHNMIQKAEVISFDIFDTLVKRNVLRPRDVHSIVEREFYKRTGVEIPQYRKLRIEAEQRARAVGQSEEISLNDIFLNLNWSDEAQKELLKAIELQCEVQLCVPQKWIQELYQVAIASGKTVIITSDMYLPEAVIKSILEKCGYRGYEKLYLSSSYLLCKGTGHIFDLVKKEYSGKSILHIGDDIKADYFNAKRKGISAALIDGRKINLNFWKNSKKDKSIEYSYWYSLLNNYAADKQDDVKAIGYEVLAPMLFGFCQWLHDELIKEDIRKIFFLSREGKLLRDAYQIMYPEDERISTYLYVSRLAVIIPLLAETKNFKEMIEVIKSCLRNSTLKTIGTLCGLDMEVFAKKLSALDYDENTDVLEITKEKQPLVFDIIKELGQEKFVEQHKRIKKYFEQEHFEGKIAVVDIGWAGTMQNALTKLVKESGTTIYGYYLGVRNMTGTACSDYTYKKGFLFSTSRNEKYNLMARFTTEIFEMLFLNSEGSVKEYVENGQEVIPLLLQPELQLQEKEMMICLQNAALEFLKETKKRNWLTCQLDEKMLMDSYAAFAVYPSIETLSLFSEFNFLDVTITSLLPKQNILFYIFHFKQFSQDINVNLCKIWFMKWLFKINLPYFEIFCLLDKFGVKSSYRKKFMSE